MTSPGSSSGKSPRRELQGPRPPPLKIRKDSHKIKKPPVAPPQQQQHRQPVIIYTVSPKVIHTDPSQFMTLVQRLTGSSSSSSSSFDPMDHDGAVSPAARYAAIEKSRPRDQYGRKQQSVLDLEDARGMMNRVNIIGGSLERSAVGVPGILSPGPSSLPPIPADLFLPSDPSPSFFRDLSPVLHSNRNFMEGSFMPTPSTFSPTPPIDLFNHFLDF